MAKKRYLETRQLPPQGFSGVRHTESRVIELEATDPAPEGAAETTEPVRDWALDAPGGQQ